MIVLIIIVVLALVFDFTNGFHDVANSIATIVSTKVLTPSMAVLWAAIFNFVAFFIFKEHKVAESIAGIVSVHIISFHLVLAATIAAITLEFNYLVLRYTFQLVSHANWWISRRGHFCWRLSCS